MILLVSTVSGQSWISKMGGHQFFLIELEWSGGDRKIRNHYQRTNDLFHLGSEAYHQEFGC